VGLGWCWLVAEGLGRQMQRTLDRLGIPLTVVWAPDSNRSVHGEIKQDVLCVYDE
jgi:hypothetical protein